MNLPKGLEKYMDMREQSVNNYWLHHWVQNLVGNWTTVGAYGIPGSMLPVPRYKQIISIASGASLNNDLGRVREMCTDAYTICGPSNLPALVAHGIRPDLCLLVDGAEETANYIRRLRVQDLTDTKFMAHPAVHPYVLEYMIRSNLDLYMFNLRIATEKGEEMNHWYNALLQYFYPEIGLSMPMASSTGNMQILISTLFNTITKGATDLPVYLFGYDFSWKKGEPTHVPKYQFMNGAYREYRKILADETEFDLDTLLSTMFLIHENRIMVYDASTYDFPIPQFLEKVDGFVRDHTDYPHDRQYERFEKSLQDNLQYQKKEPPTEQSATR